MFIVKSYNKLAGQVVIVDTCIDEYDGNKSADKYEAYLQLNNTKYTREPSMFKEGNKFVSGILFTLEDYNDIKVGDLVELKCFDGSVIQMTVTEVNDSMIVGQNNEGTHWGNPSGVKLIEKNMNR